MASIDWPFVLAAALVSQAPIREPNLAGWWSMNTVSEYPTGTATYFQDVWATTDGWTAFNGGSISAANGILTWVRTGIPATFQLRKTGLASYGTSSVIKMRLRLKSGSQSSTLWTVGNITNIDFALTSSFKVVSVIPDMAYTSLFLLPQNTSDAEYEIDWIYIGDGSYAANSLLDNSGNGNHGQIFGATPTAGVCGNALILDGTNDYIVSVSNILTNTSWSFSTWINSTGAPTDNRIILGIGAAGAGRISIRREASSTTLALITHAGGSTRTTNVPSFFADGVWIHLGVVITWATGAYVVYKNGAVFASGTLTGGAADTPVPALLYLGNQSTLTSTNFFPGTIDEPRIYNRALSAAEVRDLYNRVTSYQALPEYPLQAGYRSFGPKGVLRSPSEAGIDAVRRRWTKVPDYVDAQYQLTSFQRQLLEDFWKRQTKQGTLRFNWPHPEYGLIEARFRGRPMYSAVDVESIASVELEIVA